MPPAEKWLSWKPESLKVPVVKVWVASCESPTRSPCSKVLHHSGSRCASHDVRTALDLEVPLAPVSAMTWLVLSRNSTISKYDFSACTFLAELLLFLTRLPLPVPCQHYHFVPCSSQKWHTGPRRHYNRHKRLGLLCLELSGFLQEFNLASVLTDHTQCCSLLSRVEWQSFMSLIWGNEGVFLSLNCSTRMEGFSLSCVGVWAPLLVSGKNKKAPFFIVLKLDRQILFMVSS